MKTWLLMLLVLPVPVLAQTEATFGEDIVSIIAALAKFAQTGNWWAVAVLALVALTWVLRKLGKSFWPWLGTSEGGTVLGLLTSFSSVLGAAAIGGIPITWALVGKAFGAAFTVIGGYVGVRRLLRIVAPLVKGVPWLYNIIDKLSGAQEAAAIKAATEAAYQPLPADLPAGQAGEILNKPPVVP